MQVVSTSEEKLKKVVLYTTITPVMPSNAELAAVEHVISAANLGFDNLLSAHIGWWNPYYPLSFLSFSDTKLESFYWIQVQCCAIR